MRTVLIAEAQPCFVDERGWLESVSIALASQRELRLAVELRIDEAHERLARLNIAGTPRSQEPGDAFGWRDRHTQFGRRYPDIH